MIRAGRPGTAPPRPRDRTARRRGEVVYLAWFGSKPQGRSLTTLAAAAALQPDASLGACDGETSPGFHPHCNHANARARAPRNGGGPRRRGPSPTPAGLNAQRGSSRISLEKTAWLAANPAQGASLGTPGHWEHRDNRLVVNPREDWRARALASFPELREELEDEDDIFSIYTLFGELDSLLASAHRDGDDDALRRIYGYASWAREQPDGDIQNAAGVSFYEHLFDERWMRPLVIPWINTAIVREYMGLWELMLSEADLEEVRQLLQRARLLHRKGQSRK